MSALEGIKVIDLSAYAPGRCATMMLADFGAEVIGIEQVIAARKGDFKMLNDDAHPRWVWHQRNKRSLTLNLKAEEGLAIFNELTASADVVLEAFKPGTTKRLGVDYETVSKLNSRLVYCSISGFGQDGPYSQLVNHEPNYQALSGVMDRNRFHNGPPHMHSAFLGDLVGGSLNAVVSILMAIIHRDKTGKGQHIDVSMTAGLLPLLGYHAYSQQLTEHANLFSTASPALNIIPEQAVYETKDGLHVGISIPEPWLYKRACEELGCPELIDKQFADDDATRKAAFDRFQGIFLTRTRDEWDAFNREHDLGISPVKSLDEVFEDEQMLHRGMVIEHDYEPVGTVKHVGVPFKMTETPSVGVRNIPRYGEDTSAILQELGRSSETIDALREKGVV